MPHYMPGLEGRELGRLREIARDLAEQSRSPVYLIATPDPDSRIQCPVPYCVASVHANAFEQTHAAETIEPVAAGGAR